MGLAHEQMREVFARAEEIQSATTPGYDELQAITEAAEEVGISRPAIERALRERLNLPMKLPAPGDLAFARSTDGKFYVAEVVSGTRDNLRVRFLRGGEHTVALDELRQCSFLPGERVMCPWPWWGPWNCTVLSYEAAQKRIHVTDNWGENQWFAIQDVWIAPRAGSTSRRNKVVAALIAFAAGGAAIGSAITALILR